MLRFNRGQLFLSRAAVTALGIVTTIVLSENIQPKTDGSENGGASPRFVDYQKYPFMVAIFKRNRVGRDDFWCSGSLLTEKAILTACHCLTDSLGDALLFTDYYFIIGIGDLNSATNEQRRNFSQFIIHSKCDRSRKHLSSFDIAVAYIAKPLGAKFDTVKFMSSRESTLSRWYCRFSSVGKVCHIPGWVKNDTQHLLDTLIKLHTEPECLGNKCDNCINLRKGRLSVLAPSECQCSNIFGRPLLCDGYLFGVMSDCTSFCDVINVLRFVRGNVPKIESGKETLETKKSAAIANSTMFSFVVIIQNVTDKEVPKTLGVGSIIGESTIITTCACILGLVFDMKTRAYKNIAVVSGMYNLSDSSTKRISNVVRILYLRRCYLPEREILYDVGVVTVNITFSFVPRLFQPVEVLVNDVLELNSALEALQNAGETCYMATWGYTTYKTFEIESSLFTQWEVKMLTPEKCLKEFCPPSSVGCSNSSLNNHKALCGVTNNTNNPCWAELGGPLICNGILYGLAYYNGELCNERNRVEFASVSTILKLVRLSWPPTKLIAVKSIAEHKLDSSTHTAKHKGKHKKPKRPKKQMKSGGEMLTSSFDFFWRLIYLLCKLPVGAVLY